MNPPSCGPVGGDLLPLQKQKLGGRLCPRSACCRHRDPGWNDSARGSSLFLGVPQVLCLGSVPWLLPPSWPQGARGGASWRKSRSACPLPLRTGPPALKAAAHQLCAGIAQGLPWGRTSGAGGGPPPHLPSILSPPLRCRGAQKPRRPAGVSTHRRLSGCGPRTPGSQHMCRERARSCGVTRHPQPALCLAPPPAGLLGTSCWLLGNEAAFRGQTAPGRVGHGIFTGTSSRVSDRHKGPELRNFFGATGVLQVPKDFKCIKQGSPHCPGQHRAHGGAGPSHSDREFRDRGRAQEKAAALLEGSTLDAEAAGSPRTTGCPPLPARA